MTKDRHYTILAIGFAKWRGCDPRALAQSFRALGHSLIEIDAEDYIPWRWNGFITRVFRRLFLNALVGDYNRDVLRLAKSSSFDFILVFKGMYLKAETVRLLHGLGKPIYNFYPDVSFVDHGKFIPSALCLYDCVFTTKFYHGAREVAEFKIADLVHVRHGFDPEVHRPVDLSVEQVMHYGCDVSFVGCWSPEKERLILSILTHRKNIKVVVYGIGWKYASTEFKKILGSNLRPGVFGDELAMVYGASKVNLGLLSNAASDASISDETTVRTFQIPASRACLLHEDTEEVRHYFKPDAEVFLFANPTELLTKLDEILLNDINRNEVLNKGFSTCTQAPYDYSEAAMKILAKFCDRG